MRSAPWNTALRLLAAAIASAWALLSVPAPATAQTTSADSAAVAAVIARYHHALSEGDSVAALALLASGAIILESGGLETLEEYRSHHLASDIQFARGVESLRGPVRVRVRGDIAWGISTSTTEGEYRERAINSAGAELMVLSREAGGWKIQAIHWSSRARRP